MTAAPAPVRRQALRTSSSRAAPPRSGSPEMRRPCSGSRRCYPLTHDGCDGGRAACGGPDCPAACAPSSSSAWPPRHALSLPTPAAPPALPAPRRYGSAGARLARRRHAPLLLAIALAAVLLACELHGRPRLRARWAATAARPAPPRAHALAHSRSAWAARVKRDAGDAAGPAAVASIESDAADVWPDWWASSDRGPSPFDYAPRERGKMRVLFLTDYEDYRTRANTHTYELIDAALEHPHVAVDVWGPGWAGYDFAVPLSVNVKRRANRLAAIAASKRAHAERLAAAQARQGARDDEREGRGPRGDVRRAPGRDASHLRAEEDAGIGSGSAVAEAEEAWEIPEWNYEDGCSDSVRFDLVWTISDIYKQDDLPHVDVLDCGTLFAQQMGDCHSLRCLNEWYVNANITAVKYAFELEEVFGWQRVKSMFPDMETPLFGHSPDTGNPWDFWPVPWSQKERKAVIFGFDGSFYPIRTTITDYLKENPQSATVSRHPHPGYTISYDASDAALETYERNHSTYAVQTAIRQDFARGLREAEICIFDSSLERKMIRKYAQAFLSGCVVAADLPTEHEEALSSFVINLQPSWNATRIVTELERHLGDPERLQQMAMDAFVYARRHLTTTRKVDGMLDLVDAYRAGVRGYDHPVSFSSRCRAFWSDDDAPRPPWCVESQHDSHRGLEG